jgi:hypothetical protein
MLNSGRQIVVSNLLVTEKTGAVVVTTVIA